MVETTDLPCDYRVNSSYHVLCWGYTINSCDYHCFCLTNDSCDNSCDLQLLYCTGY